MEHKGREWLKKKGSKTHKETLHSTSSVYVLESELTVDIEACGAGYDTGVILG